MSAEGTTPIRVAVVGTGWWGEQHARAWSANGDVELCAVVGRDPARTRARAGTYAARAYTDLHEMLDRERPDLVSLCLPNTEHFATTREVIHAGVAVFVEKPLVFELDEADVLLAEAAERDLFFAINFNHRFAKPARLARRAIEKGELGEIVFATWRFGGEGSSAHHRFANLIETQCHAFDLLEHLCGPIASVSAEMVEGGGPGGGLTTMALALRFRSGAVGSLVGTYDSSYAYHETQRLEINGTRARILSHDTVGHYEIQPAMDETARVWRPGYFNDADRQFCTTFDRHVREVVRALRAGEAPPVHASAGRRALALAWAAAQAWESGGRVGLEPVGALR